MQSANNKFITAVIILSVFIILVIFTVSYFIIKPSLTIGTKFLNYNSSAAVNTPDTEMTTPTRDLEAENAAIDEPITEPIVLTSASLHGPTIIYAQETSHVNTPSREWYIYNIYKKVGDNDPELLLQTGGIGMQLTNYAIGPDKKYLVLNLESKLRKLDITNGVAQDIYKTKNQISSAVFSPDGKRLLILEQGPVGPDVLNSFYTIKILTLADNSVEKIKEETIDNYSYYYLVSWLEDNLAIVGQALGEPVRFHHFDLTKKTLKPIFENNFDAIHINTNGKIIIAPKDYIKDACNDFSGANPTGFSVKSLISGKTIAQTDDPDNVTGIIATSPGGDEILYSSYIPAENRSDCEKNLEKKYHIFNTATNQKKTISMAEFPELLSRWNGNYIGAEIGYDEQTKEQILKINGKKVASVAGDIRIIAQYYQ